jgi:hypothetical protein
VNPDTTDTLTPRSAEGMYPPAGPYGARLLHGWYETGRPAGLAEHLDRYGPAPLAAAGGALVKAVEQAGLTGRGGGGFPTGRKLRAVAGKRGPAVVIANGMESEPASNKDETLLFLAPHLVLDGAVLAAASVGATTVHLCLARTRDGQERQLAQAVEERRPGPSRRASADAPPLSTMSRRWPISRSSPATVPPGSGRAAARRPPARPW